MPARERSPRDCRLEAERKGYRPILYFLPVHLFCRSFLISGNTADAVDIFWHRLYKYGYDYFAERDLK